MVDEFVYQFQSWAQFRGKAAARGGDDLAALQPCERVWNVLSVLNYLRFLADKSGIAAELSAPGVKGCPGLARQMQQSSFEHVERIEVALMPVLQRQRVSSGCSGTAAKLDVLGMRRAYEYWT